MSTGTGVKPLEVLVRDAVSRLWASWSGTEGRRAFPSIQADALTEGGLNLGPPDFSPDGGLARTAEAYERLLVTAKQVQEVAQMLQVDTRQIEEQLASRALYGVHLEDRWLIPEFQFHDGSLLPGIADVVSCLDQNLHPIAVYRWFTSRNPDLVVGDDDDPMSPREWLRLGQDPAVPSRLAAGISDPI